jgi:hypothetical protein
MFTSPINKNLLQLIPSPELKAENFTSPFITIDSPGIRNANIETLIKLPMNSQNPFNFSDIDTYKSLLDSRDNSILSNRFAKNSMVQNTFGKITK